MKKPDQALAGLRVLDLSQYISGPYCTKLLADFGAEVIKIEPREGEIARRTGPFPQDQPHLEKSGLFLYLNTNKKGITLDLETEAGIGIFRELVRDADILVENLGPGVMARWKLDYKALEQLDPSLIMTSISYFGQNGPYSDYKGSQIVALALGGLLYMTGLPDRQPLKPAGFQAEYQAGLNAAVATMTALYFRDETGLGQQIDVSVMEAIGSILEGAVLGYTYNKVVRRRSGARHHSAYPSTILPCRDGYVHVQSADLEMLSRFIGDERLLDPRLKKARQHADEIDAILRPWLSEREAEDIFRLAQEWRLPFALVLALDELWGDPQYQARGFFVDIDHPVAGKLSYPGAPFRMSQTPCQVGRPAPLLGEHNREIYCDQLGYSEQELAKLRETGVI